jgi:hypothetical protein
VPKTLAFRIAVARSSLALPPPMRLSRDLLIRGIIYQLQERASGGLSMATLRKLAQAGADPSGRGVRRRSP